MIEKVPSTLDKAGKRDVRHLVFRIIEPLQELLLHAGEAWVNTMENDPSASFMRQNRWQLQ